jgi:Neuraminidase (sialidase)
MGVTWSTPVPLPSAVAPIRYAVKISGSLGVDGAVFVQSQYQITKADRYGNIIYRSTDGGVTWVEIVQNTFAVAGRQECTSGPFRCMYSQTVSSPPFWLEPGWGELGVGPNGVIHYVYSARLNNADPGRIYYIRSTDNGSTWSAPKTLATDPTFAAKWGPSLAVNATGRVVVTWYDERNAVDTSLERFGRVSYDNGATWGPTKCRVQSRSC